MKKVNEMSYVNSLGYHIFCGDLSEFRSNSTVLVSTINQYSYCIGEKDPLFKNALLHSDILLPDGVAIVAAVKIETGKKIKKVAGADLHKFYLKNLNAKGGTCFYLGSSENTLKEIKKRLAIEYPSIKAGSYSPPYKNVFSQEDTEKMIKEVNQFKPDILFIGMTAPKQEKWAYANKSKLHAKTIVSIGAAFDFYAGTVDRPGKVWINLGMEWIGRLVKEPKRMWKRYLYYGPVFIFDIFKRKIHPHQLHHLYECEMDQKRNYVSEKQ